MLQIQTEHFCFQVFLQKKEKTIMKKLSGIIIMVILIVACSSSDEGYGGGNESPSFDQGALLSNLADNLIIPSFNRLQEQLSAFDVARATFVNERTQENLNALSSAWQTAYLEWQHVEMYNIGEAELQAGNPAGFVSFFIWLPVFCCMFFHRFKLAS